MKKLQQEADEAAVYTSLAQLQTEARRIDARAYGWVHGHFVEMYPGGRSIDISHKVSKPNFVALLSQGGK